jgi:large subunit ribosomal protein L2
MAIKKYRPTTAGRRLSSVDTRSDVTKSKPEKRLTEKRKKSGGRNSTGRITVRRRGGGAKQRVRVIDFRQDRYDIPAKVAAIEYDPTRGARLMLLNYKDGVKSYAIAPQGVTVGDEIVTSREPAEIKVGNRMPLSKVPEGMAVHNIELEAGRGGTVVRGAGASAQRMAVDLGKVQVKLPSGEIRMFHDNCLATIGTVSNPDHRLVRWGKAGRSRLRGKRPSVRGKAMNPVDHPHGGGEGRNPIGLKHPKTPWGKPALGVKTRKKKKASSKMIVKRRK